jgi:uncharacterized protein (UPF0332 family)
MSGTKDDYIRYRISKSWELFEDAKLLAQNKRWNSCVNRLYYSSFHLASALLYKNNYISKTHNGVKTNFFHEYIKPCIIKKEYGQLYSRLFDWRQESDYSDFIEFDAETILPIIDKCFELNKEIEKIILMP